MINYTGATEGDAYLDMSQVDTSVTLTVGCIQVIFLNKFVSSILVRAATLVILSFISFCGGWLLIETYHIWQISIFTRL